MKAIVIILAVLFVAMPASAAQVAPAYVTVNTDVDVGAEQLSSVAPTSCNKVILCNGGTSTVGGVGVIRFKQSTSALSGTIGGVATTGFALFPAPASGETCITLEEEVSTTTGKKVPINAQQIYVASSGYGDTAMMACFRNDQSLR